MTAEFGSGLPLAVGEEQRRSHVVHTLDPVNALADGGGADDDNDVRRRRRGGMGRWWGHDDKRRPDKNDMARRQVQSSWEEEVGRVGHCPRVAVEDGIMRRCTADGSSLHKPRGMLAAAASYLLPLRGGPSPVPYRPHWRLWSPPPYTHCHDRGGGMGGGWRTAGATMRPTISGRRTITPTDRTAVTNLAFPTPTTTTTGPSHCTRWCPASQQPTIMVVSFKEV